MATKDGRSIEDLPSFASLIQAVSKDCLLSLAARAYRSGDSAAINAIRAEYHRRAKRKAWLAIEHDISEAIASGMAV